MAWEVTKLPLVAMSASALVEQLEQPEVAILFLTSGLLCDRRSCAMSVAVFSSF